MWNQASAIVWAQMRTLWNYLPRANLFSLIFTGVLSAIWYGGFAFLAVMAAVLLARPAELELVRPSLPTALLGAFIYWQLIPVLMASMGSSLDLKKLLVYPIPKGALFSIEILLRVSTGVEVILVTTGAGIGLLCNPKVPFWAPFWLVFFVIFNLLCSASIRDLVVRTLARKHVREIVVFLFVVAAGLPQLLILRGSEHRLKWLFSGEPAWFLPWTACARLASGQFTVRSAAVLLSWTLAAFLFGRWQFERSLAFDFAAAESTARTGRKTSRFEWLYQLPNAIFRDPLAALIEKELRFLSRAPRFRLVFLMGFSFGLLVWLPMAFGRNNGAHSLIADNYLTFVSVYALLLLSDALFWNCFGFDRSAAQIYFLAPFKMSTVLIGKNLAAASFVFLEIALVSLVCAVLRLPFSVLQVVEALAVTTVVTLLLLSVGNLSSFYNPRAVNPSKSLRQSSGGRVQALLILAFPVALLPVALAYLARYAFRSEWAFFGVLLVGAAIGGVVYALSLESAVKAAEQRREQIITALSGGEGPVSG
jgi:ABC-2 type transport system permease protein